MNQRPHLPPRNLPAPKSRSPPLHRPTPLPLPPPRSIPPHRSSSTMTMTGTVTMMIGMMTTGTMTTGMTMMMTTRMRRTMTMTTTNAPQRAAGSRGSVRVRLLIGMILLAGLTLLIAGAVNYFFERKNLETTLDEALARDVEELRVLADTGIDPNTQQHFTNAADLMYTAMQYNQVAQNQSMLAMQDGAIVWGAPENVSLRLEDDPEFVAWASELRPQSVHLTTVETERSTYRVAVMPIELAEDTVPGVFLEAFDAAAHHRELQVSLAIYTAAGAGALVI